MIHIRHLNLRDASPLPTMIRRRALYVQNKRNQQIAATMIQAEDLWVKPSYMIHT